MNGASADEASDGHGTRDSHDAGDGHHPPTPTRHDAGDGHHPGTRAGHGDGHGTRDSHDAGDGDHPPTPARHDAGDGDHPGTRAGHGDGSRDSDGARDVARAGGAPRITPLPPGEWPAAMRDALAALIPAEPRHPLPERRDDRPKGLNVLGTLARHPALTRAYHAFNGHVLFATTLSVRQRELLVLRVAAVRRAAYEWAQHVVLARDAGIGDDEIARVAEGPGAAGWAPLDQALVAAVDELLHDARIADATWKALSAELDEPQLMDLVFTVGAYDVLAMALRTFAVELDDDLPALDENGILFTEDR